MKESNCPNIIKLYDEYIKLLNEEISELVGYVIVHTPNWESSRVEKGAELRIKISQARAKYIKDRTIVLNAIITGKESKK